MKTLVHHRIRRPALIAVLLLSGAAFPAWPATPGEATDLTVTGFDAATGNLSLSWTPACSAANHHIEYGPLDSVATYGYTGQVCGIGMSGVYTSFNPGAESYFFLVVADDGIATEGSYGTSMLGGTPAERPADTADPSCAFTQNLVGRCDGPFSPTLGMTAYRPPTGTGASVGAVFQRWAVPPGEELSPGAGVRVNGDDDDADGTLDRDDTSVAAENDLVEVTLTVDPVSPPAGYEYALTRIGPGVRAWTSQAKGTELLGAGGSAVITFSGPTRTIWVENPDGSTADLELSARPVGGSALAADRIHFVPLTSVVIALGGESQVPADPPLEPTNHGTFQLAITLYRMGYDVHMYDEDVVPVGGLGAAYNEVVAAVQKRGASHVAIYGYSHGGGSTNDLAVRLNANRAAIGAFSIDFTAYVDGIDNDSDLDISKETALPASTAYHANWYETPGCSVFPPICGGPIAGANLNVNVTTQPWGSSLTHYTIDDAPNVIQGIHDLLIAHVPR